MASIGSKRAMLDISGYGIQICMPRLGISNINTAHIHALAKIHVMAYNHGIVGN